MLTESEHKPREARQYDRNKCIRCQKEIEIGEFTWHTEIEGVKEFCSRKCYQKYETKLEELRQQWKGKSFEEFLNVVYPNNWWRSLWKRDRKNINLVDLTNFDLRGDLDVSDFGNGHDSVRTEIILNGNPNLGKIVDRKGPEKWNKTKIIISRPQEYLDYWYPINGTCVRENESKQTNNFGKRREEIGELDISHQQLTGELDLSDFVRLTNLDCRGNQLTSLNLSNCSQLTNLAFSDNYPH